MPRSSSTVWSTADGGASRQPARSGDPRLRFSGNNDLPGARWDTPLTIVKKLGTGADLLGKGMEFAYDVDNGMHWTQAASKQGGTLLAEFAGGVVGGTIGFGLCGPICAIGGAVIGKAAGGWAAGAIWEDLGM